MFRGARSDSMVRNQVCRGRPERRCQSLGRGATLARRARLWSMEASARAMWPMWPLASVKINSWLRPWRRSTLSNEPAIVAKTETPIELTIPPRQTSITAAHDEIINFIDSCDVCARCCCWATVPSFDTVDHNTLLHVYQSL